MAKRKRNALKTPAEQAMESLTTGSVYVSGLTVQDVPSHGRSTRTTHSKTPWVAHLFSDIETKYRYLLEWSDLVEEVREQFPLDLPTTLQIAETIGVKHPVRPRTKEPATMTTDFVITTTSGRTIVSTVKPYNRITMRDVEKFEIERRYWVEQGATWGIVTDKEIPETLINNIRYVRKAYNLEDLGLSNGQVERVRKVAERHIFDDMPLNDLTFTIDDSLGLQEGTSLNVVRYLIATKAWIVDMMTPIDPGSRLNILGVTSRGISQQSKKGIAE